MSAGVRPVSISGRKQNRKEGNVNDNPRPHRLAQLFLSEAEQTNNPNRRERGKVSDET
jgi:hypothetical protein